MNRNLRRIIAIALPVCITVVICGTAARAGSDATLKNLESAYDSESNTHNKYLAYARQADEEGYGEVASLFRAAARSEEIHLNNDAALIRKMGAVPKATIKWPVVGSTWRNLELSAKQGEAYERDAMYTGFVRQARVDNNADAVRTFEYARDSEAQHSKLFSEAFENLGAVKGKSRKYYVCTVSGYTMEKPDASKCPDGKYETLQ